MFYIRYSANINNLHGSATDWMSINKLTCYIWYLKISCLRRYLCRTNDTRNVFDNYYITQDNIWEIKERFLSRIVLKMLDFYYYRHMYDMSWHLKLLHFSSSFLLILTLQYQNTYCALFYVSSIMRFQCAQLSVLLCNLFAERSITRILLVLVGNRFLVHGRSKKIVYSQVAQPRVEIHVSIISEWKLGILQKPTLPLFSSPEHEVLMVSYCGQWLSVVRRRPSCVVRRASCVVRQHLMFTL